MVIQETSIESYDELKSSGKLGELQKMVFNWIVNNPDCSQKECEIGLKRRGVGKRYSELFDRGLIASFSRKKCQISGKKVMTWRAIPRREMKNRVCPHCKTILSKVPSVKYESEIIENKYIKNDE